MRQVLLHVCCAPCSTHCIEKLRSEKIEPVLYFYNPNIHPKSEYDKRLDEVKKYSKKAGCELIVGEYDSENWHKIVEGLEDEPEGGKRCAKCFELRLENTAKKKKDFTTSLTVSKYKNSKVIIPLAKELAEKEGIIFLDYNFKKEDGYNKSIKLSKENNLYRQDYCGCVYSKLK
ncbi:recombinase [Candidatus Woesearchaeota archaeon]|nr:MAG: recombinase [Candidatus Woesearchaeota archaeon]